MTAPLLARLRGPGPLGLTLAAIVGAGLLWLAVDVRTEEEPSTTGDRFERIDAWVEDQLDDFRIPGAALAIVEDGVTVHATGYGSDGRGDPISADTPFWFDSKTKSDHRAGDDAARPG